MTKISAFEMFRSNISAFTTSQCLVPDNSQLWYESTVNQLNKLVSLKIGWDGYRAIPVSFENAHFAMRVLQSICGSNTPSPQIAPGVSGDLQIEWHTLSGDLELHILAPNHVIASYSKIGINPVEEELVLTFDFTDVARYLLDITEESGATIAAAA